MRKPLQTKIVSASLQHINVKFFLKNEAIDLEKAIRVFHNWIQEQKLDDLLIDVADYRHVPSGPGVILIGHNAHYALDNSDGRLGVLYNRRTIVSQRSKVSKVSKASKISQTSQRSEVSKVSETSEGAYQIREALDATCNLCRLLESENAFEGKFELENNLMQIMINDRLIAANDEVSFARCIPEIRAGLIAVFGEQAYEFERAHDPRKRLTIIVKLPKGFSL